MNLSAYNNLANYNGLLSTPVVNSTSFLNLNNLPNVFGGINSGLPSLATPPFVAQAGNTDKDQLMNINDAPLNPLDCGPFWGTDKRCNSLLTNPLGWFTKADFAQGFKSAGLLLFAGILLAFGLYMLAKSTDTGKIVINSAKMAAV